MARIHVPHSPLGKFCFFFATQCLSYFLFVANARAYTQGLYLWTGATDGLFAMQSFIMLQLIAKDAQASGFWAGAGYTLGGVFGSLLSIFVTQHLYGH
jgi:hypothetical protein